MTIRGAKLVLFTAAVAMAAPQPALGSAADAFEHKFKPVSGRLYQKSGKVELTPLFALSFNDAFFKKYMGGAKLGFHFSESFSFSVVGAAGTTSPTGSTMVCPSSGGCAQAEQSRLNQVPGEVKWLFGGEVAFSPIYGKLNIIGEKALHFDLSILGGADLVAYRKVLTAAEAAAAGGVAPASMTSLGGHLGLGARLWLARFMALRLEVKDVLYGVSQLDRGRLQNQFLAEIGLSFFIPIVHRDN